MPKKKKIPIYTASKSLDVKYIFKSEKEDATVKVPAVSTHAMLVSACDDLLKTRNEIWDRNTNL